MILVAILKKIRPSGIRSRLILGVASILVILMSLLVVELMNNQKNFFLKLNHDRALGLSNNLAYTSASYIASYELAGLQKLVSTYKNIPGVRYAMVISADNIVLANTDEKYLGLRAIDSISAKLRSSNSTQTLIENNSILDIATPIMNHDNIVGWARIGLSQDYIEPNLQEIRENGIVFILISLVVGSVFALFLGGRLTDGLQKLLHAAGEIKGGQRDVRVEPMGSIEVARLGTAFNQMLDDISANEKLLKESELLFKNLVEKSLVGVYIIQGGKYVYANPKLAQDLGYSKEELLNLHNVRVIVDESYRPGELEEWRRKVDSDIIDDFHSELKYRRKDGRVIWAEVYCGETLYKGAKAILGTFQDITERKEAEVRIMERESQLTTFFESIDGSASLLNAEKKFVLFNKRFIYEHRRITDHDPWVGEEMYDVLPEEMRRERLKILDNVLNGNKEVMEVDFVKNGQRVCYLASFNPVITGGRVTGICIYSMDLIKSKEADERIRESEEKFRMSFMTSQDAFYIGTLDEGRIVDVNNSFYDLFGYTREESIGKTSAELKLFVYPEDRERMVTGLKTNGNLKDLELTCRKKNGELIIVSVTVNVWQMNNEQVIMAVISDITERKRTEVELKESELKFKNLVEKSLVGVYILQKGKFVYVNPRFAQDLGYAQEEMVNMEDARQVVYQEDKSIASEQWRKRDEDGVTDIHVELRYQRKDGEVIWAEVNSNETLYKGAKAIIGTFQDITERKNAEAVIKEQAEVFTAITENANESMWLLSPDLKILQFNKTAKDRILLNRGKEIYHGANFIEFLHIGTENIFMPMFCDALAGKYAEQESSQADIYGNMFWLRTRMYPTYNTQKKLIGVTVLAENITNRKEFEKQIEQSEERNRALIENIADAIILLDESLKPIYRSPSVTKILGFLREEMIDKSVFDSMHPDDLPKSRTFFQKVYNSPGIPIQAQFRLLHKYGHYIWVEGTVMNMLHNKSINALIVTYRDITERRKFEEQQLLIASIVNSSDDAIISKNLNGIITSWNKGAQKVLGYTFEEVIGRHISVIIPDELKGEEETILKSIRKGRSVDHFETRRVRKDGVIIDALLTVSPIADSLGNIIGASEILRDITESKKAEERIRHSEANYRQLFDNSPAPMCVIDEGSAVFIQVNQACIKNYGYSEEEFRSKSIKDISPDELTRASGMNVSDIDIMSAHRHRKRSGELIDVITSSIPVILNGQKSILMTAIDVTEKTLYEQKLAKAAIKAQEEERYEIGGELHDNVCQILVSALIYLKMMKDSLVPDQVEYFDQTSKYITHATEEIRNLSHRLAPALFDEESLEDAFKDLLTKFNIERKFEVLLRFDRFAKKRVLSRELQLNLYRVLQEQLRNILKHAKATRVEVFVSIYNNVLLFRIIDNGVGLNSQQGKKGIGLANMNRRIELFSGSFAIISPPEGGCEVRVEIPLAKAPPVKKATSRS
jgi:PAS domain S-box-containing protein